MMQPFASPKPTEESNAFLPCRTTQPKEESRTMQPIGETVLLVGLRTQNLNGQTALVIAPLSNGRVGVQLHTSGRRLSVRAACAIPLSLPACDDLHLSFGRDFAETNVDD